MPTVPRLRLGYRLTFANYAGSSPQTVQECSTGAQYRSAVHYRSTVQECSTVQGHNTVVQYRGTLQGYSTVQDHSTGAQYRSAVQEHSKEEQVLFLNHLFKSKE